GMSGMEFGDEEERRMKRTEAIILSMTPLERRKPLVLNGSRRKRIAMGSGTEVRDVNQLLKQFTQMQKMMKQMRGGKGRKMMAQMAKQMGDGDMKGLGGLGGLPKF